MSLTGCIAFTDFYRVSVYEDGIGKSGRTFSQLAIGNTMLFVAPVTATQTNFSLAGGLVPIWGGTGLYPMDPTYYPRDTQNPPYTVVEVLVDTVGSSVEFELRSVQLESHGAAYIASHFETLRPQIAGAELRETLDDKGRISFWRDGTPCAPLAGDRQTMSASDLEKRASNFEAIATPSQRVSVTPNQTTCLALKFPVSPRNIHPFRIVIDGILVAGEPVPRQEFRFRAGISME